ncbi:hypothetical protein ACFL1E_00900 [Candidatus Omnitrophota bacterium]
MEFLELLAGWANFLFPLLLVGFLLYYIVFIRRKREKRYYEVVERSLAQGKEQVEVLREIRDLLKK